MADLYSLNEDILLYLTPFIDLYGVISLSQTCRRFFALATHVVAYWKSNLQRIKPAYLARVKPWSEYEAIELRDAAILSRNSDLAWNYGKDFTPHRLGTFSTRPNRTIFLVPRTRWAISTRIENGRKGIRVDCRDLRTGKIGGYFIIPVLECLASYHTYCADGKSISPNEIRLLLFLPRDYKHTIIAVYKVTFEEKLPVSEPSILTHIEEFVFEITENYQKFCLSDDGIFLAMGSETSISLTNTKTRNTFQWRIKNFFPEDLIFLDDSLLAADSRWSRVAIIHIPHLFRPLERPFASKGSSIEGSNEDIRMLSLSTNKNGNGLSKALNRARELWLLPPKFFHSERWSATGNQISFEVAWLTDERSCSFSTIYFDAPLEAPGYLSTGDSQAYTTGFPIPILSNSLRPREENPALTVPSPSTITRFHRQRTIIAQQDKYNIFSNEKLVHVLGVDRLGKSRSITLPSEYHGSQVIALDEGTGVILFEGHGGSWSEHAHHVLWLV
ncbi:hypothetical protein FRC19_002631 [Serendipita sp. 401]|nr:hypothetical protein FRC19_002631 [Serendipita sp. 401]KAG9044170.1 hypothetical protein FS842_001552 [Serendipita sp. 407]